MFGGMILFYQYLRLLTGLPSPSQGEIKAIANEAVDLFVESYQV